ncbi:MAG: thymidine phosphorylase, partial [Alphaproteobacteria bacterium]|nr:thymidine phosphorylase [Alphaproteobacteria bacterium]
MTQGSNLLQLKRLGIDTYKEAVIYLRTDCHMCRSEGFEVHARVRVTLGGKSILATLNTLEGDLLQQGEASLSNYAWELLGANDGDPVQLSHPNPLQSLSFVRSKIYGNSLKKDEIKSIIGDIALGRYSDIHIAAFLTACAGGRLNEQEVTSLT